MAPPSTRRERRAAQLARQRQQEAAARPAWASPAVLVTLAAVLGGIALVAVLVISGLKPSDGGGTVVAPGFPSPPANVVHGRSMGDAAAPVKIEAWADFQCPVCKNFTVGIEPQLISRYVTTGKVQVTYRDLAFIGQESFDAAIAARVSEAIGPGFWPMHDLLFANQGEAENSGAFSRDRLASMAALLGMDRAAFLSALDDPKYRAAVTQETQQGTAAGINQTPTLVINGVRKAGLPTFASLAAAIDQAAGASPAP